MKKHVSLLSVSIALFAIGCGSDGDDGELIGGKGEPEIAFTFVPELGSQEVLRGKVFHVLPSEYKVTVLIQVCGGWWTKPYAAAPDTTLSSDGGFKCDIATGGGDVWAFRIIAFLIPADFKTAVYLGVSSIPEELLEFPSAEAERTDFDGLDRIHGVRLGWVLRTEACGEGNSKVERYEPEIEGSSGSWSSYDYAVWKDGRIEDCLQTIVDPPEQGVETCIQIVGRRSDGSLFVTNRACVTPEHDPVCLISPAATDFRLSGLCFGPYVYDGQDPRFGSQVSRPIMKALLGVAAKFSDGVRFYGMSPDLADGVGIAKEMGLKVVASAWIGRSPEADAGNENQISKLIELCNQGSVDIACVGNEVLLRGDQTPEDLIALMDKVREGLRKPVPVTTGERYSQLEANPQVAEACDILFFNSYPFWDGSSIDGAVCQFQSTYLRMKALAGSKAVVVSETGWPSAGQPHGLAVPSTENAARYFREFVSWAHEGDVEYYYFEIFDEPWKMEEPGGVGVHFGIFEWITKSTELGFKEDIERVFDGDLADVKCP